MTDLPALVTASVRTADGARYLDHADLTSHLAVWIKAALVRQHGIADVVVTAHPQNADPAERRTRYAAAIWERNNPGRRYADCEHPWQADAEEDADAVIAVADAEQAELRTRISELESSCRDTDRLRKDWVEMRDRVEELDERAKALAAATVPASASSDREAACICGHSEAQHFEDACITEVTGCDCGDFLTGEAAREVIARWRDAASGPGRADGETQQDEGTTADRAAALGLTDAEYRARSHAAAVAAVRSAIPGMYAHVGHRLEDVLNEGGETQQDETQAPYPPSVEWHTETQRRGDYWSSWSCVRYELAEAQSAFAETVKHDRGRHAWRLVRETTAYAVEAEQPAAVSQPDGEA